MCHPWGAEHPRRCRLAPPIVSLHRGPHARHLTGASNAALRASLSARHAPDADRRIVACRREKLAVSRIRGEGPGLASVVSLGDERCRARCRCDFVDLCACRLYENAPADGVSLFSRFHARVRPHWRVRDRAPRKTNVDSYDRRSERRRRRLGES